jgi:hypothetical protein
VPQRWPAIRPNGLTIPQRKLLGTANRPKPIPKPSTSALAIEKASANNRKPYSNPIGPTPAVSASGSLQTSLSKVRGGNRLRSPRRFHATHFRYSTTVSGQDQQSRLYGHVVRVDGVLLQESLAASSCGPHSRPGLFTSGASLDSCGDQAYRCTTRGNAVK